eukprot:9300067-Karenia_brevis.AAC.1
MQSQVADSLISEFRTQNKALLARSTSKKALDKESEIKSEAAALKTTKMEKELTRSEKLCEYFEFKFEYANKQMEVEAQQAQFYESQHDDAVSM